MTLKEFLNTYNDSDQYLVDSLPEEMWGEFILPPCLLCGGFTSRLQARIFCSPRCFYISFSKMMTLLKIKVNVCTSQLLRKQLKNNFSSCQSNQRVCEIHLLVIVSGEATCKGYLNSSYSLADTSGIGESIAPFQHFFPIPFFFLLI